MDINRKTPSTRPAEGSKRRFNVNVNREKQGKPPAKSRIGPARSASTGAMPRLREAPGRRRDRTQSCCSGLPVKKRFASFSILMLMTLNDAADRQHRSDAIMTKRALRTCTISHTRCGEDQKYVSGTHEQESTPNQRHFDPFNNYCYFSPLFFLVVRLHFPLMGKARWRHFDITTYFHIVFCTEYHSTRIFNSYLPDPADIR